MAKKMEIKKIPLKGFIESLIVILNSGVDHIDMVVAKGAHQDSIWLIENISEKDIETKISVKPTNFEELT